MKDLFNQQFTFNLIIFPDTLKKAALFFNDEIRLWHKGISWRWLYFP
jgi:hypothetical protein